jgi:nicotinate-nucleotide--dimethylbenzimidazole phosphoribosyltransferase
MPLLEDAIAQIEPQDPEWRHRARERLEQLTMPYWALGRLLDLAVELAGMTRSLRPPLERRTIAVFAGDHGVDAQGVSRYPQEVTGQMVRNFAAGGAGINALARVGKASLVVVNMGVAADLGEVQERVRDLSLGPGTGDISEGPAMSPEQARASLERGIALADELAGHSDVLGTGDMGIGNTTPSAAIAACLTGADPAEVTGRGAGLDELGWKHKVGVVRRALEINRPDRRNGLEVLAKVGGFEIGGLAGFILGGARHRRPVVVDGFISTAAALIAQSLCPAALEYAVLAHSSAEAGHKRMCAHLGKRPLLDLEMRLGEGTGAALALPLLEGAGRVLSEVRTFAEAGVSGAEG